MSWIDRIENTIFTIRTGDGQFFYPDLPINYQTTKDFNVSKYEFIDQPGSLIDRKEVQARSFPLTFYFQGENNIEQAEAFDSASNDPRAWTVRHPFYGDITGQPTKISRDDTKLNCTEITVDFWETISLPGITTVGLASYDAIAARAEVYHVASSTDYANTVILKPADVSDLRTVTDKINTIVAKGMDSLHYSEYQQLSVNAFTAIDNAIDAPYEAMYAIQTLLLIPSRLDSSVSFRAELVLNIYGAFIEQLIDAAKDVSGAAQDLTKVRSNLKSAFEAAAGYTVGVLANTFMAPSVGDFVTRNQVAAATAILVNTYNNYLINVNSGYVSINGITNPYSNSFNTQNNLQAIVLQALVGLNAIAFNAKQERQVILDRDSQLIVLTHKYMGLDPLDENIETFRTINNIKNSSLFLIPKGNTIIYYA